MKVELVESRLSREHPDEEVVVIIGDDTSKYYEIDLRPFLHAGPVKFKDNSNKNFQKSVVIIRVNAKD